jgi:hypothetical protein
MDGARGADSVESQYTSQLQHRIASSERNNSSSKVCDKDSNVVLFVS